MNDPLGEYLWVQCPHCLKLTEARTGCQDWIDMRDIMREWQSLVDMKEPLELECQECGKEFRVRAMLQCHFAVVKEEPDAPHQI